jgi:hypothetical protein
LEDESDAEPQSEWVGPTWEEWEQLQSDFRDAEEAYLARQARQLDP